MTKARHNVLILCAEAIELLKGAGFERVAVSLKTEATYWRLPGREDVLRVATHRSKKGAIGLHKISARLTFRGNCNAGPETLVCSPEKVRTMTELAVGQYVLAVEPPTA